MTGVLWVLLVGLCVLAWSPGRPVVASPSLTPMTVSPPHPLGASSARHHGVRVLARMTSRHRDSSPDVGVMLTQVAGRLRAGADPGAAWAATLSRAGSPLGAAEHRELGVAAAVSMLEEAVRRTRHHSHTPDLAGALVACRLSGELGAPLAPVLDSCARGVAEAARARDDRRVALAGPRATARLLGWLPFAAVALAQVMGGDPLSAFADGSWGTLSGVSGVALAIAGRQWMRALVRSAMSGAS